MTNSKIKSKAKSGIIWSAIEKLSVQGFQFIIGIILARLLSPNDFGLIGMLAIFFSISQTLVDSGMASGLIQKTDRTEDDFSTVFVFNLGVSVIVYFILFNTAPLIADFFEESQLIDLTRVVSLMVLINAISVVQRTRLTIALDFKSIARINLLATLLSGSIAIYGAYIGWGVWALAVQMVVKSILTSSLLWFSSNNRFSLTFKSDSFKNLFGFGSKLLVAGLYAQLLNNIYNLAIGKKFPTAELGYYTRGKQFADLSSGTISGILQQVTFPLLASVKEDKAQMVSIYKKVIQLTAFIIFPAMTLLTLLAAPLIDVLLGSKWYGVIPLLQWIAIARIITPISVINMSILNAIGRSDLFLKLDLAKFPLVAIALIISIPIGVKAMVIAQVCTTFVAFFMNAYLPGKLFGYGALGQIRDMLPIMIATAITGLGVYYCIQYFEDPIVKLFGGTLIGGIVYFGLSYILRIQAFQMIIKEIQNKTK